MRFGPNHSGAGINRRERLTWTACLLLVVAAGHCARVRADDYLIDSWNGDNGLPDSSVTSIVQTPEGYLWIGTHNGLARFDGARFVVFDPLNVPELKHARVWRLFVDSRGTLWINTYDGSLTSWRRGKFAHEWRGWAGLELAQMFTRSNDLVFATKGGELVSRRGAPDMPGRWLRFKPARPTTGLSYRQDAKGTLWYNTRDGAVGWVDGTNAAILPAGHGLDGQLANCLEADSSGRIWVGTDQGISVWNGERFEDRTPTNGDPKVNVSFLFFTRDGACWAIADHRLRKFAGRRWVAEAKGWGELFGDYMPALQPSEDREGRTWFCHYGQGVFLANPDGTFGRLTSTNGLPGDRVDCWLQDREGNIWLGVDRGGLVRLRKKRFQVIGPSEGLSAQGAMSVCQDPDGAIWIGTYGGGLNRWQDGRMTSFTLPERPTRGFIFSVYPGADNTLWLSAGREDLYIYREGQITKAPWDVHGIKAELVDREGNVWFGKKAGLSRLSHGVLESFGPTSGFDYTVEIHALAQDARGDIWAGAGNGVLYDFHDGKFTAHRPEDRWGGNAIWSLLPDDDGTIWVGTFRGGLLRFQDGRFTRYTTQSGLPDNIIGQILDDGKGNLWLGSHKGIFRVAKSALRRFARGELASVPCRAFGMNDGLPTLECSSAYQPSAWRGRDGRLWFATFKGVVSVRPEELPTNELPPPVIIEELRVDGLSVKNGTWTKDDGEVGKRSFDRHSPSSILDSRSLIEIPPGRHYFEIRYTALSYVAPDKVKFRYRLEGLEDDWIEAGTQREAHFSHLPPGRYVFRVAACNNDDRWNRQGATLAFTVLPHFYETRSFLAVSAILAVIAIAGTVRSVVVRRMRREMEKLERQRALERDRARIAQDIHDELGAGLTRIMLQSELARRDPAREMPEHLSQIGQLAHGLTRTIDEIVWAVDPQHDTLAGLMDYGTAFAEEFLKTAEIRCRIDLPETVPAWRLDAETRYSLFLALKEALNNVVRHAQASEVCLRLRLHHGGFTLVVEDNGRGLSESGTEDGQGRIICGHGLTNLQRRLLAAGGKCVVESAPGRGTRVEMTVTVKGGDSAIMAMATGPSSEAQ